MAIYAYSDNYIRFNVSYKKCWKEYTFDMFVTQFLSHEWYTLFGRGFMGEMDKKIAYFSECIQLINVDGRYVPDVYHIVLHILIIIAFVVTLLYREEKTLVDEV